VFGRIRCFRKHKLHVLALHQVTVLLLRNLDRGVMHKHVAAILHPFAVSEGSDEPKPRLIVEPFYASSKSGGIARDADVATTAAAAV
jgi:hypothetical protein